MKMENNTTTKPMENKDHIVESTEMVTAVEWLAEQMHDYDHAPASNNEEYVIIIPVWIFKDKVNTAKQMEKEQIIKAFDVACDDLNRIGREYYRDTYETYNVL
jgi:hypothetical protein